MPNNLKRFLFLLVDFIMINAAFILWSLLRARMGFFARTDMVSLFQLSCIIYLFWLFLFIFFGHYLTWLTRSRTDEFISLTKTITIGLVLIFLFTVDINEDFYNPFRLSRMLIIAYWGLMVVLVGMGRLALITLHRKMLEAGIGLRDTIIVGTGDKARELAVNIQASPALGYRLCGYVAEPKTRQEEKFRATPLLGACSNLRELINKYNIQEVLIGLDRRSEKNLEAILAQCEGTGVGLKIIPSLSDLLLGQARTNQLYGSPLIEITPQLMAPWEWQVKRFSDIVFSLFILVAFLPFWLLMALCIKLDSRGPLFYKQKRVGMNGKEYTMIKFRSMVEGAEKMTGPVWASWDDPRVTKFGRFMRRARLDEIPQLLNVIKGDMSWVGPRPERPFFVKQFTRQIPLYARRLRIRPGITGWAQIKGQYDQKIEHVKEKLAYDLFYLENMSLRMDVKIILSTIYTMLRFRGH